MISTEKSFELARDIHETARDLALDDCEAEARLLDRRLQRDPNVSNEQRAQLVCECFTDYADACDIPGGFAEWCERFPTLAEVY